MSPVIEQPVHRQQPLRILPQHQLDAARPGHDLSDQRRILGLGRVTRCRQRIAAPRKRPGQPPVDRSVSRGRFRAAPVDTELVHQRVQAPDLAPTPAHGLQQTRQARQRVQPGHQVLAFQHFVEEFGVHPLENPRVEYQCLLFIRQVVPEARLQPVLHRITSTLRALGTAPFPLLPLYMQRQGPPGRLSRYPCHFPSGKLAAEESRHLRPGEPQFPGRNDLRPVEKWPGDIHTVRKLSTGQHDMQVGNFAAKQFVENRQSDLAHPFHFIQREYPRAHIGLDRAQSDRYPTVRLMHSSGIRQQAADVQSSLAERECEVRVERLLVIPLVQNEPRSRYAGDRLRAAAFRHQGRLAEPRRRMHDRQGTIGRNALRHDLRAMHVADHAIRHGHTPSRQPPQDICLRPRVVHSLSRKAQAKKTATARKGMSSFFDAIARSHK